MKELKEEEVKDKNVIKTIGRIIFRIIYIALGLFFAFIFDTIF